MTRHVAPAPKTVRELEEEFLANGLSGWIWEWVLTTLVAYVQYRLRGRYRASLYSPSGEWDEVGTVDLVNEFLTRSVVGAALMAKAMLVADTPAGVQRYLEKAFHNFVIRERGQSLARNVYTRLRSALEEDPELLPLIGLGARASFGPSEWSEDPPPAADSEALRGAEQYLPSDLRRTDYSTGKRRSPVLERNELLRAAHAVIRGVGRPLSVRQLLCVLGTRFDLSEATGREAGEEALFSVPADNVDPLEQMVAQEAAEHLLERLSPRQRLVLRAWFEEPVPGCRELGERLGCSKSTVSNERTAVVRAALDLGLVDQSEQGQAIYTAANLLEARELEP